mmetsp:Transcript_13104/g.29143  ORF Transcript_13104/g.29143 Transcript_13104/m.29143 type:complete len:222 (+) Transcript_13104:257-922(+)
MAPLSPTSESCTIASTAACRTSPSLSWRRLLIALMAKTSPFSESCTNAFTAARRTSSSTSSKRPFTAIVAPWSPFSTTCGNASTAAHLTFSSRSSRRSITAVLVATPHCRPKFPIMPNARICFVTTPLRKSRHNMFVDMSIIRDNELLPAACMMRRSESLSTAVPRMIDCNARGTCHSLSIRSFTLAMLVFSARSNSRSLPETLQIKVWIICARCQQTLRA